jgi:ATP-dependent Lhr-like helicase
MVSPAAGPPPTPPLTPIIQWFDHQGWQPLEFQRQAWAAYLGGHSGLIQVPTGAGKTYAAVLGPIAEMLANPRPGLQLLYLTPLRALSRDLEQAIAAPIQALGWPLRVECRSGDTSGSRKAKQIKAMPEILITTPESLALLLSYPGAQERFGGLRAVIIDEWHELMGSKRGTQTELCLSSLRSLQPQLRTWALSATLGNLDIAAQTAVGLGTTPVILRSSGQRPTQITSLRPQSVDSFPWAGHLGLRLLDTLVAALDMDQSTLMFTNTRNQAERWYQALTYALPEHQGKIALHHGSMEAAERAAIEAGVKAGSLKWVVCTSSLDLGVDFQPVQRVVQIGSPKNLARLLQRAGRSAHVPAGTAEVFFLPTHALELLEMTALRRGLELGDLEHRPPQPQPYDVLIQHLLTLACGDGFDPEASLTQVRQTVAYQDLSQADYQWILDFIEKGGRCLGAYPRYQKVVLQEGRYRMVDRPLIRLHRLAMGTITSNTAVRVVYTNRREIGTVEEAFVSRLKKGDVFFFAGRQLQYVQLQDMVLYVKNTQRQSTVTPTWTGGQLALSHTLSHHLRHQVEAVGRQLAGEAPPTDPEIQAILPILEAQRRLSTLPKADQLLVETCATREGEHLYGFPLEGRFVHQGLGLLWSYRFAQQQPATFTISVNDYGFELLGPKGYPYRELFSSQFFNLDQWEADLAAGLNLSELTQRQFRGIAQVAGLVFPGYPGARKTGSQLQVSSSLLYQVFSKYEPDNLLLVQARREVLDQQLESHRLAQTLARLGPRSLVWQPTPRPSPLAFLLLVERLSSRLSNESLQDRIERLKQQWQAV